MEIVAMPWLFPKSKADEENQLLDGDTKMIQGF